MSDLHIYEHVGHGHWVVHMPNGERLPWRGPEPKPGKTLSLGGVTVKFSEGTYLGPSPIVRLNRHQRRAEAARQRASR